jgi:hypothetical protein
MIIGDEEKSKNYRKAKKKIRNKKKERKTNYCSK